MKHEVYVARKTASLLFSLGEEPKRLNSKAKVRFANRNGHGEVFMFGDKVFIIDTSIGPVVVKA